MQVRREERKGSARERRDGEKEGVRQRETERGRGR